MTVFQTIPQRPATPRTMRHPEPRPGQSVVAALDAWKARVGSALMDAPLEGPLRRAAERLLMALSNDPLLDRTAASSLRRLIRMIEAEQAGALHHRPWAALALIRRYPEETEALSIALGLAPETGIAAE